MARKAPKKRMNRKMKRTIRKSLSALFMATAVAVAAIPVQENAAAGGSGGGTAPGGVEEIGYDTSYVDDMPGLSISPTGTEYTAYAITQSGENYYSAEQLYKVKKVGTYFAIVGYNLEVRSGKNSSVLEIPAVVAREYEKFEADEVETKDYYTDVDGATGVYQKLATQCKRYGIVTQETDKDGNPVYKDNGTVVSFAQDELTEGVRRDYALEVLACEKAGGYGGYKAVQVWYPEDSKYYYVPYSESDGFYAAETYPVNFIADGAFSTGTFSNADPSKNGQPPTNISKIEFLGTINGIGDNAFKGMTSLREIDLKGISTIGNHAFEGCTGMTKVALCDGKDDPGLTAIGTEAFKGCNTLQTITMPYTLSTIGDGAFANCLKLSTVDMGWVNDTNTIGDFAFYNCPDLNEFVFSEFTTNIGMGAFAIPGDSRPVPGSWKDIVLPDKMNVTFKYDGKDSVSVFEGRDNLQSFVFPSGFGNRSYTSIPKNFFRDCVNLKYVNIPGQCVQFDKDNNPFDTTMSDFYIEGPAMMTGYTDITDSANYSSPRKGAHDCGITYKFTANGEVYYEVASAYYVDSNGKVLLDAQGNPVKEDPGAGYTKIKDYYLLHKTGDTTAKLVQFIPDDSLEAAGLSGKYLTILGNYNGFNVTAIEGDCFKEAGDTAIELDVQDNTISQIADGAFENFSNLEKVTLGNKVSNIGKDAFAGCSSLKDVYFNMDSVKIGENAFKTGGTEGLTFHGKIAEDFEPFKFAMNKDNDINGAGLRILYKSLEPSNLAVLYNNGASTDDKAVVTLVSYPINYCDDTAELIAKNATYDDAAVRKIVIPSGVTSIDTVGFFGTGGKNNDSQNAYVAPYSGENQSIYATWQASTGSTVARSADGDVVPGLFSGAYDDYSMGIVDGEAEKSIKGNDYIYSVEMSTVESLPDFAFDSCENLNSVILGAGLTDIGTAPFRGCTSLASVGGNDKFVCDNGIIYEVKDDGTYALVECLAGRALNTVSNASDPLLDKVSEVKESAFEDCENIGIVDLSTCKQLTTIEANSFKNCSALKQVKLPETVNAIYEKAFADIDGNFSIEIPAKEVYINSEAFANSPDVTLYTYEDTAAWRFGKDHKENITLQILTDEYCKVQFLNWDFTELFSTSIKSPGYVKYEGAKPTRSGYTFTGWRCLTSGITYEGQITESCIFIAQFDPIGGAGGNGSGNGSGSGSNNGSVSGNNGNNNNNGNGTLYTVTVVNGSGSGSYAEGATVTITANDPAKGKKFANWTTDNAKVSLASTRVTATTFTMPAENVTITANYEDDKSSSGSNSSNNGSNSNSVSGNSSNRNNSTNGTKVIITRPGISDTDLAAAKVNGSKDGFIVKISETAEATAAVEEALTNKYGSLDNIRYVAMDISLYDSTGTNKITDTTGYTIDITIPIPDALKEYAGNNKTAAVANAQLEELSPKFTTIDGVPCVTFRATHFSPYTIYVDTQNLSSGTPDTTPKTGDGIHPKWFLSIGLASLSIILFMKKDKKSPKVKVA